jgi:hypothetical protein
MMAARIDRRNPGSRFILISETVLNYRYFAPPGRHESVENFPARLGHSEKIAVVSMPSCDLQNRPQSDALTNLPDELAPRLTHKPVLRESVIAERRYISPGSDIALESPHNFDYFLVFDTQDTRLAILSRHPAADLRHYGVALTAHAV